MLGLALGVEREFHHKAAGIRTNTLIAIGSALFTAMSIMLAAPADQARVAAQVVTGVGFLGAGAILHRGESVQGLTTAAVIWMDAAIGMTAGAGHLLLAASVTVLTIGVLIAVRPMEAWFERRNVETGKSDVESK